MLAQLANKTQVLFFTHHDHLLELAEDVATGLKETACRLVN